MRKFLTLKVSMSFWMLLGFLSVGNIAMAQSFYIEFLSPAEIRGQRVNFVAGASTVVCHLPFGDSLNTQLTDPILAGDPNDPNNTQFTFAEALNGNVGVCKRGSFSFNVKASNIEFNGGSGSIIINNDQANKDAIISMSQDTSFSIWSVAVSFNSGENFFLKYPGLSFKFVNDFPAETDNILWSDNGFSGGLDGWTTVGVACGDGKDPVGAEWEWTEFGSSKGAYGSTNILSATACNGAMTFNTDFKDNDGVQGNFGGGICGVNQIGELISPDIDLSALPEETAISLRFNQAVRQFQSRFFVSWSNDGGANWHDIEVNKDLVINDNPTNGFYRLKLGGAKPSANFKLKFTIQGNYYYWIVDDVKLIEPEDFNSLIDKDWLVGAPYATTPISQVTPVKFMTDAHNIGGKSLTGMKLTATVTDEGGNEVYTASFAPTSPGQVEGTVLSGDTIQNHIFGSYTPDAAGVYTIKYDLTSDQEDFDPSNNSYSTTFTVTDDNTGEGDFSRENEVTTALTLVFGDSDPINWIYANVLRGENEGSVAKRVKFGVANANDLSAGGASLYCYVWECEDSDGDYQITEAERTLVGFNFHDMLESDPDELYLDLPILDFDTEEEKSVEIKKGKWYIVGVAYEATSVAPRQVAYILAGGNSNQNTVEFIALAEDPASYVPTHFQMKGWNFSSTFNLTPNVVTGGRGAWEQAPYARLVLDSRSSVKNLKLADNTFSVYPTNASENISVKFNFENGTDVNTEIYDVNGNRVYSKKMQNQKDQTNIIETGNFVPGAYFVRVTTSNGALSKPFNVIK